jgi:hypothetical protein
MSVNKYVGSSHGDTEFARRDGDQPSSSILGPVIREAGTVEAAAGVDRIGPSGRPGAAPPVGAQAGLPFSRGDVRGRRRHRRLQLRALTGRRATRDVLGGAPDTAESWRRLSPRSMPRPHRSRNARRTHQTAHTQPLSRPAAHAMALRPAASPARDVGP